MSVNVEMLTPTTIEVDVLGRIDKADYERLEPLVQRTLNAHERVAMVVNLKNFSGWTPAALWEDLKFDVRHFNDIDRLAVVGEDASQGWMATVSKPFTSADVEFFGPEDLDRARAWASTGSPAETDVAEPSGGEVETGAAEGDVLGVSNASGELPGRKPEPGTRGPEGIEIERDPAASGKPRKGATAIDMGGGGEGHRVNHSQRRRARST